MELGTSTCLVNAREPLTRQKLDLLSDSEAHHLEIVFRPGHFWPEEAGQMEMAHAFLRDSSMALWSAHMPYGGDIDYASPDEAIRRNGQAAAERYLQAAADLGASVAVMHPSSEPVPTGAERELHIRAIRRTLEALEPVASDLGLQIGVELLPRSCLGNRTREILRIIQGFDKETVGVCLDSNHANLNASLPNVIREIGDRIVSLHISDNDGDDEKHWFPFKGVIEWEPFMSALVKTPYQGPFMYESRGIDDPEEAVRTLEENYLQISELAQ
jgi:sugar phosphate isomerase/epimerase